VPAAGNEAAALRSAEPCRTIRGERLDRIAYEKSMQAGASELREAALSWIELHSSGD